MTTVSVIGATGFVGSAVSTALEKRGCTVVRVPAPRLAGVHSGDVFSLVNASSDTRSALAASFAQSSVVVNAAGNPDASSRDTMSLNAANGALPGLAAAAAADAGVFRFIHVSSAVVQGRRAQLDETSHFDAFSSYASSKVLGEKAVLHFGAGNVVIYRPPSVHGIDRRVTRMIARIAASPFRSVARPGDAPSPQALITNVADAIAHLATVKDAPPSVVIHPWEGLTTSDVMRYLGGRDPHLVPPAIAAAVVKILAKAGTLQPRVAANARRVEMLWFGQGQADSWLTHSGWAPPADRREWIALGEAVRRGHIKPTQKGTASK